jgi:serine/threonine protein kinase
MPRAGDAGDSSRTHICPPKSATPYPDAPETKTVPRSDKPELEGSYTLHNTIGKGGFSKVKMGIDVSTGAKVAIKIIDKESIGVCS